MPACCWGEAPGGLRSRVNSLISTNYSCVSIHPLLFNQANCSREVERATSGNCKSTSRASYTVHAVPYRRTGPSKQTGFLLLYAEHNLVFTLPVKFDHPVSDKFQVSKSLGTQKWLHVAPMCFLRDSSVNLLNSKKQKETTELSCIYVLLCQKLWELRKKPSRVVNQYPAGGCQKLGYN